MADTPAQVRDIFAAAAPLRGDERRALLEEQCGDDVAMRRLLDSLLAAHDEATSIAFLSNPTDGGADPAASETPSAAAEGPGSVIDRYRILQLIGEGGFGSVYLAEQERPVRRRVALKIIKLGMDTRQVIARFEAERQALALMDHPNIAKVLDAGATDTGRPYFVMELVQGVPITQYCDDQSLPTMQRLELFMTVCHAVQHAHQKGIIHRDIKPSNVLVTLSDDTAVPKVIDFGIAKATNQQLTEQTVFTQLGQFIGTPEYMSPEQAVTSGFDIDTRSDVYSLGVLLYELLTGTTPFDGRSLRSAGLAEIQRIIREEDPPRPSTRLSSMATMHHHPATSTDAATVVSREPSAADVHAAISVNDIARHRRSDPRTLSRHLRGDLDWIVMKALEKDRTRRYETASGFAIDVARYLRDEPVSASPPGAAYRMRKFVRRHRAGVATAAAAVLLLVGFAVVMAIQAKRISSERDRAETQRLLAEELAEETIEQAELIAVERDRANRERQISDEVVEFQADMLRGVDPQDMGRDLVADLRSRVADAQDERNASGDEKSEALTTFDALLAPISTTDAARRVIDVNILQPSTEAISTEFGEDPATEARLRYAVARTYRSLGLPAKALPQFERSYQIRHDVLGPDHSDTLRALTMIGDMHFRLGDDEAADAAIVAALERWKATAGMDDRNTLDTQLCLGVLRLSAGENEEGRDLLLEVLEHQEKILEPDSTDIADTTSNLGAALINLEQFEEAEPHLLRALQIYTEKDGTDSARVQFTKQNLSRVLAEQNRHDEAIAMMHEVVDAYRRVKGATHPSTMEAVELLAASYGRANRHLEVVAMTRRALDDRREVLGERHPSTLDSMTDLGIALAMVGDHQAALPMFEEVLALSRETLGPEHRTTMDRLGNLGVSYWYLGRIEDAAASFREAYEISKRVFRAGHPDTAFKAQNLAIVYTRLQRLDEAEAMLEETLATYMELRGPEHKATLRVRSTIASLKFEQGDKEAALEILSEIHPIMARNSGAGDQETIEAAYNLILCCRELGRDEQAETLLLEYIEVCTRTRGADHDQTLDFVSQLAALYFEQGRIDEARPVAERMISARRAAADEPDASMRELHACAAILLEVDPPDLRDPAAALAYATRMSEADEEIDAAFLVTLARAQHETGDPAGAARTQQRALDQLPEQTPDREEYEEQLAEYLEAAAPANP